MIISNNKSTNNSFIDKFFELKNEMNNKSKDEFMDGPFIIRKKTNKII